ncbi:hypothetical protein BDY19DRAFT_938835 [Irpex rosettiformis]|uniref:Uncharacterized protein n=1 Tax=Irpex rosettiformis TaxID=378272 RepID=A0ACB8U715_9APHY|nr:hypothetical protein BDY19DRAFT_938835 [Irpex rosettiformis]
MQRTQDHEQSYSWHQSHDQATVLFLVPYDTDEEDIHVIFDHHHLVAGVRGQQPLVKGRLYGSVDIPNSSWQLEPRASRLSARERTTSTTSTASTQSSFAFVSETDASNDISLVASLDFNSDWEDSLSSPALSSPISLTAEGGTAFPLHHATRRRPQFTTSHPVSPHATNTSLSGPSSIPSSISSLESLHAGTGRLLTIHVEKAESMIWPSLIVGPVPEALSPSPGSVYPWNASPSTESGYNIDPTSMVLIGLDLFDIRDEIDEAFEYFVRAWHQAHVPSAIVRLASHYLPVNMVTAELLSESVTLPAIPSSGSSLSFSTNTNPIDDSSTGSRPGQQSPPLCLAYYLQRLGGRDPLAQLYLEAGLLFLDGSASGLLASSYAGLSSLRTPTQPHGAPGNPTEAWRRDQEIARRFFDRARQLRPELDVPLLPSSSDPGSEQGSNTSATPPSAGSGPEHQLQIPTIDLSASQLHGLPESPLRKRRRARKEEQRYSGPPSSASAVEAKEHSMGEEEDNTWYLYLPGLVGAGTALLVVGFLSFSSWRKGQSS